MRGSIAQNGNDGCIALLARDVLVWCLVNCRDILLPVLADGLSVVKGWLLVIKTRSTTWMRVVPLVFAIVALAFLTACGGTDGQEPATDTTTALANLGVAESAVATLAPDAKLLVVQAPSASMSGGAPLWVFLFGSPETGEMFSVSTANGVVMDTARAGAAPLETDEWASVPETAAWDVDSDEAYETALDAAALGADPTGYVMVMETYVPASAPAEPEVTAFVWYVTFTMADADATPPIVAVDASTGEATLVE